MYLPPYITKSGDEYACNKWLGRSIKELAVLSKKMNLSATPNAIKQQIHSVEPERGVSITCYIGGDTSKIHIHVDPVGAGEAEEKKTCMCWPCFAFAIILKTYTINNNAFIGGERYTYDVAVCYTSKEYAIYTNDLVRSPGFEKYEPGQFVLVTFDVIDIDTDVVDCCATDQCIATKFLISNGQNKIMVTPFNATVMQEWLEAN